MEEHVRGIERFVFLGGAGGELDEVIFFEVRGRRGEVGWLSTRNLAGSDRVKGVGRDEGGLERRKSLVVLVC